MLQYVFDTDHLTLFERGQVSLIQRMSSLPGGVVGTTAVTVEEALRGPLGYLASRRAGAAQVRGYALLIGTLQLCARMPVLAFDNASESHYQFLRSQIRGVGTQDLKIAAIALANNVTVLTRNRTDFARIPGLQTADWSV